MPLTLTCVCPGDSHSTLCDLDSVIFHCDYTWTQVGDVGGFAVVEVEADGSSLGGSSFQTGAVGGGSFDVDVTDYASNGLWGTLDVHIGVNSSTFSPCSLHDQGFIFNAGWYFVAKYRCIDSLGNVTYKTIPGNSTTSDQNCCITGGTDVRSCATAGGGGGSAYMFCHTPLGDRNAANAYSRDFEPLPDPTARLESNNGNGFCLCASGGTDDRYRYYVASGQLPGGLSLDPQTGCITGEFDGTFAGTGQSLTFGVMDGAGETATVSCDVQQPCVNGAPGLIGNSFY